MKQELINELNALSGQINQFKDINENMNIGNDAETNMAEYGKNYGRIIEYQDYVSNKLEELNNITEQYELNNLITSITNEINAIRTDITKRMKKLIGINEIEDNIKINEEPIQIANDKNILVPDMNNIEDKNSSNDSFILNDNDFQSLLNDLNNNYNSDEEKIDTNSLNNILN